MTSAALYKKLQTIFQLPSIRRLQQLSSSFTVHTNNVDMAYLSSRVSSLSEKERIVLLIFDEVYTAAKVEYENGEFVGRTEEGEIAKTLLVYMVHSLNSKYKDVVKLIPVAKYNKETLQVCTLSVVKKLGEVGFKVQVLSADNHAVNR